jgi:hypothetical protein
LNATLADKENCVFIEVVGQFVGENNQKLRKDYEAKIATLETRLKDLEQQKSLEARFLGLQRRLDARQQARDEAKRGSEMIPQSQPLPEIEKLQHHLDEKVAGLDGPFRELTERVIQLEATNSLEASFTKLADEVKHGSEIEIDHGLERLDQIHCRLLDTDARVDTPGERRVEIVEAGHADDQRCQLAQRFWQAGVKLSPKLLEPLYPVSHLVAGDNSAIDGPD